MAHSVNNKLIDFVVSVVAFMLLPLLILSFIFKQDREMFSLKVKQFGFFSTIMYELEGYSLCFIMVISGLFNALIGNGWEDKKDEQ